MKIVEVFVASEGDIEVCRKRLDRAGVHDTTVRVLCDPWIRLPAVQTEHNLYQGEANLSRILTSVQAQRRAV